MVLIIERGIANPIDTPPRSGETGSEKPLSQSMHLLRHLEILDRNKELHLAGRVTEKIGGINTTTIYVSPATDSYYPEIIGFASRIAEKAPDVPSIVEEAYYSPKTGRVELGTITVEEQLGKQRVENMFSVVDDDVTPEAPYDQPVIKRTVVRVQTTPAAADREHEKHARRISVNGLAEGF